MAIVPIPGACANCGGGGGGGDGADAEQLLLCDLAPDGEVLATVLAVYEYDSDGNPAGAPTFVIPGTNDPYVVQGTLQACPGQVGCGAPQQFCFTSSDTTDTPGRMYDATLTLGQGFAVTGICQDLNCAPTNVLWDVNDGDGSAFADDLEVAINSQFPGATVTVGLGTDNRCLDGTREFNIHIECLRLDQDPPLLVQLQYNAGRDLVINAPYAENPPLNPIVQQGNYGFRLLARQDDPGPFPGNQPQGRVDCTNTANRGWETNDVGRTFEIWGQDIVAGSAVTPTPRGTPVQEISSDGPPPGGRNTIWQTFNVPAAGNFNIRVIHGARDPGENHIITLSTGDTDDNQVGDIINNVTNNVGVVTNTGGPGPWTTFSQVVALAPGLYTLAISTNNPAGGARGGLFTDMRAFLDAPGSTEDFVNNDDTCTVEVTGSNTTCEFWAPRCVNGTISSWYNVADGEELTNAAFWAQVPAPICCTAESSGGGDAALGNLVHTYLVCGVTETGNRTLSRVVITDQNGAPVSEQFYDTNGALVTPSSWQPGTCPPAIEVDQTLGEVCWIPDPNPGPLPVARGFMTLDAFDNPVLYNLSGQVVAPGTYQIVICPDTATEHQVLCDLGNGGQPFIRWYRYSAVDLESDAVRDTELDGSTDYVPVGPVGICPSSDIDREVVCWTTTAGGDTIFTGTIRHDDALPAPGWILFDQNITLVLPTEPGLTFVPCSGTASPDFELICARDNVNTLFWRAVAADGTIVGQFLTNGTPFVPAEPVVPCAGHIDIDVESFILCDSAAPTPNRFIRNIRYGITTGVVIGFTDTTLAGAAFAPVGAVQVCPTAITTDTDFVEEILCDANGTSFIRLFRFNSTTGVLISSTNTTLAGAAFAPVGVVGLCSECCPIEIGRGCTNTGSLTYTALRLANGTIQLIDSVTGAAVLPANIVACPTDDVVVTLRSQHFDALPGTPWTPAAVTGTATSVTYTVIAGTATVTDHNGTVIATIPTGYTGTWNAEDNNTLTLPTSISADAASRVLVLWTEK